MRTLNDGRVGCDFMGRTHSNVPRRVGILFDLEYQSVLKAICDFNEARASAHAARWEGESFETDDESALPCRFAKGSLTPFESTRYARGHKALYTFEETLETRYLRDAVLKSARTQEWEKVSRVK